MNGDASKESNRVIKRREMVGPAVPEKVARNINDLHQERLTFGQKAADTLAKQAGSWRFIFIFLITLGIWMILNSIALIFKNWDPYPFILLNLVLSCLAAIQAPVIMMSQNRQEERDRLEADADYDINVKAEAELERLHKKLDRMHNKLERLYSDQVKELLRLQEEQMRILGDMAGKSAGSR